jgi:50S ribosomal subunit-associated GTPase HflX
MLSIAEDVEQIAKRLADLKKERQQQLTSKQNVDYPADDDEDIAMIGYPGDFA